MTVRTLGVLLLKLWGVLRLVDGFTGVLGLGLAAFLPAEMSQPGMRRYVLLSGGLTLVVNLAIGALLLTGAERIMAMIGVRDDEPLAVTPDTYSARDLQSVVFGGIGVYLAIVSVSSILQIVYRIARQPAWNGAQQLQFLLARDQEQLAGAAAALVCAVILLVNRSALAGLWARVHPMGAAPDAEE
ncbi:MAG: hypothetical protein M3Q69_11635 [Acidobacteriota bacterium]|nr:hypothetical protein [Acidobacteriota bacterium]